MSDARINCSFCGKNSKVVAQVIAGVNSFICNECVDLCQDIIRGMQGMSDARRLTLYRDDSTTTVVYERVKAFFWTANNTVLVVSQYTDDKGAHRYIHWPRERFCWFKDEPNATVHADPPVHS